MSEPSHEDETAKAWAEQVTADVYDRPSIETREEFKAALEGVFRALLVDRDEFWFRLVDEECRIEHGGYFGSHNVTLARHAIRDEHNEVVRLDEENDRLRAEIAELKDELSDA